MSSASTRASSTSSPRSPNSAKINSSSLTNRGRHRDSGKKPAENQSAAVVLPSKEDRSIRGDAHEDVCFICTEPIRFYSVAECNHRTCHVCALRLRALYKRMECTFCKHPQPRIIFTTSPSKPYEEYKEDMVPYSDDKLNISFETIEIMEETLFILRFNCPDSHCVFIATGWVDLKGHVRDMHGQLFCDLCIRHKKVFTHEHTLYSPRQLSSHLQSLRKPPTMPTRLKGRGLDPETDPAKDFDPHPMCIFCKECFYGPDEIFAHLREKHEECFVCKRMGNRDIYFQNYERLDQHFQAEHFPCMYPHCLEEKFVVFSSLLDLNAHQVRIHGETMTGKQKKDKMRVEAGFTFEDIRSGGSSTRSQPIAPRNSGNSGGLAIFTRRAVLGDTLTTGSNELGSSPGNSLLWLSLAPLNLFLRNLTQSAQFSVVSTVRSFKASECTARDMLDNIFNVFNRNLDITGTLVIRILELFESQEEKKNELLQSWNGLKIEERQQFPSLVPVASSLQAGYSGITSGRMLNIKKPTHPSSSTHQTSRRVWDRVEQAATSSVPPLSTGTAASASFPSLASVNTRHKPTQRTAWSPSSSGPSSSSANAFHPVPTSVLALNSGNNPPDAPSTSSIRQFPSLPSTLRAPTRDSASGNPSVKPILRGQRPVKNAWGVLPSAAGEAHDDPQDGPDAAGIVIAQHGNEQGGGRGKRKKGKEILFTLGALAT
ncbi:hypothetical protein BS47DRAFT_1324980 [Hydnum rufescens UP504]|uniref:RING-type E3 ubiquitin transferase n=1 Tax=Hydnum rufescens UP504 TaxID=1448309 RepID=A0A9P6B7V6_9AGAM|nr:hypothetical protein BS47DRAFT_1324980 [Hydnum rufescens UP504]